MRIRAFVALCCVMFTFDVLATPLPPSLRKKNAPKKADITKVAVRRIDQIQPTSTTAPTPKKAVSGDHNILVVMIETDDATFDKNAKAGIEKTFFDRNTPSLTHYYTEQSYGTYSLSGKVLGPIHIKGKLEDFAFAPGKGTANVQKLIAQAFDAAEPDIDMGMFDRYNTFSEPKKDGVVDHFAVIFPAAGTGHDGVFKPIWPHRGTFEYGKEKKLKSYYVFSHPTPLGILAHEHGHDIGLPDLYDHDDSSHGAGPWCLMATGEWLGEGAKPSHISAWGKVTMGWVRPQIVTRSNPRMAIAAVETTPTVLKIPIRTADSLEYFLVENRQRIGYDAELPEEGLLIWHVDQTIKNNDDEGHKLVDLMEPSALQDLDRMLSDSDPDLLDTFRAGKKTKFSNDTQPSSVDYAGKDTGISITNISASRSVMTASFTVPTLEMPDGEQCMIARDNYAYGAFGAVVQPIGNEELMPLTATEGAFDLREVEVLITAEPRASSPFTLNVYDDDNGTPGKLRVSIASAFTMKDDAYAWHRVKLNEPLRIAGKAQFWLGILHQSEKMGLAYNGDAVSKEARVRKADKSFGTMFNFADKGEQPIPDFIIRAHGYGYIGVKGPGQQQADDSDALIASMREADALLDKHNYQDAAAQYNLVLQRMSQNPKRFSTWIPTVINSLGVAEYQAKNYAKAIDFFSRSLRYAQMMGDPRAEADVLENIGETHFHAGNMLFAEAYCTRAAKLNKDTPDRLLESEYWLGRIAMKKKAKPMAMKHLAAASKLAVVVHSGTPALAKWKQRIGRAKSGKARGEDPIEGDSRLVASHDSERLVEQAPDKADNVSNRGIDMKDFGGGK